MFVSRSRIRDAERAVWPNGSPSGPPQPARRLKILLRPRSPKDLLLPSRENPLILAPTKHQTQSTRER